MHLDLDLVHTRNFLPGIVQTHAHMFVAVVIKVTKFISQMESQVAGQKAHLCLTMGSQDIHSTMIRRSDVSPRNLEYTPLNKCYGSDAYLVSAGFQL